MNHVTAAATTNRSTFTARANSAASLAGRRLAALALALALYALLFTVRCEVDYKAPLVNGYAIVRANSTTIWVVGPSEDGDLTAQGWAGSVVVGVDVIGEVIVGHAITPLGVSAGVFPIPGYFVIETTIHQRWLDLTKEEYDKRCELLGIKPDLKSPRSFKQ